jgi:hypothetical protein
MLLKGMVRHIGLGVYPDMISAPMIARHNGIESVISAEPPADRDQGMTQYWNLVSVEAVWEDGCESVISGSVLGTTPHIVQVDNYQDAFAFKPEGNYVLTFRNEDKPGAVLQV